jgi:hypothetical protein
MNLQQRAVVQQALEVIETPIHEQPFMAKQKAITALRQLLEQPVQSAERGEPKFWYDEEMGELYLPGDARPNNCTPLYTHLPAQPADHADDLTIAYLDGVHTGKQIAKREWVDLTEALQSMIAAYAPSGHEDMDEATLLAYFPEWKKARDAYEAAQNGGAA